MTHTATSQPRHTNRLANATSPYLLQHRHNPVDWYEWGPEALDRSRREDKPIFLSIGYSACHWCHVMERESFENEEIAAVMNEHFINIKVDREERPDLDDIYMMATQVFTKSGGWPMSVWLTPDQKPFFAGTYFPPEERYGRPGFKQVLLFLSKAWKERRDDITEQANTLTEAVRELTTVKPGSETIPHEVVLRVANFLGRAFDPVKGGMSGGGTNKFPPSMAMDLMLRAYHHAQTKSGGPTDDDKKLLQLVELTLDKMAHGGIYDQLGGGFARYSTDVDWLVPHFEKMLYDQALVSDIYLKAFQLTGKPLYARIARETFDYVIADLQSPEGGYYSTRDADSEGHEGRFYVWSKQEVDALLGPADSAIFCDYYDVSAEGNWEGTNILNVQRPLDVVARLHKLSPDECESRLAAARSKLFAAREKRVKPHLDDKILASWNGLMIASMAKGYRILGDEKYRDSAARAADFVCTRMMVNDRLQRTCRQGKTHTPGYLDDHAFMIDALLNLYETTFDVKWLDRAAALNEDVLKHFRDEAGGFFFSADDAEKTLVRAKDANDGAIPSGNSVQFMNLQRLAVLLDRKDLSDEADRALKAFGGQLSESPFRSERFLTGVDFYHRRPREVAVIIAPGDEPGGQALINAAWRTYVPNLVIAAAIDGTPEAAAAARRIPLLAEKKPLDGKSAAYVCRNYACRAPTSDPAKLREELAR
ncbi:MAG: thioredoxin domain-containing protein [Planctomycetota bacterium]|nr:MAG: thioredoxin domain-containing protein [Planctomycetota bacterium]